ncbi:MAG TPA: M15 family metallopeptidase [Gammaproteobacteria bacterium]|nr:M15 family metallopeptidase [Gammaproteobacteria bacterium]
MISNDSIPITAIIDPKVLAIPIQECGDGMMDLTQQKNLLFGESPEIPNNQDYTKLRIAVYEKLLIAQQSLPNDLKFCLYEGYRSLQLQEQLFNQRYQMLKQRHPDLEHPQLFQATTRMVSPTINLDGSTNIPPHATGGAFDIYLVDMAGEIVDMGIRAADWMQDYDGSLSKTDSLIISDQAKHYRAIMSQALNAVGFVNYPWEYWHWSYGDRYWAHQLKRPYALYGAVSW